MSGNKSLQKYLRKYMSKDEINKRKKVKVKQEPVESVAQKKNLSKIVDDDIDMKRIQVGDSELIDLEVGDDAPQIAGIVDERPVMIQAEERFGSYRWKAVGHVEDSSNKSNKSTRKSRRRNDSDSDQSPERTVKNTRKRHDSSGSDLSPTRITDVVIKKEKIDPEVDLDSDLSPERETGEKFEEVRVKVEYDSDLSPERAESVRTGEPTAKMSKTLDGKSAGLQSRAAMEAEKNRMRREENEFFEHMDASVSGRDATTIVRKKGKKVDLVEKERREREKKAREAEREAKYQRWGKGLKQIEMTEEKRESDLKEMEKPLARYANDEELDRQMRERERDGDPMLKFLKKKKTQVNTLGEKVDDDGKPKYQGSAPPNRFKIRPGFRWDGVDRSSGFERDRFMRLANKQAAEVDVYKWSIEDM